MRNKITALVTVILILMSVLSMSSCGGKDAEQLPAGTGNGAAQTVSEQRATPTAAFSASYYNIYYLTESGGKVTDSGDATGVLDDLKASVFKTDDTYKIEIQMKGKVTRMKYSSGSSLCYYLYIRDKDGNDLIEREMRSTKRYKAVDDAIEIYETIHDLPYSSEYQIIIRSY